MSAIGWLAGTAEGLEASARLGRQTTSVRTWRLCCRSPTISRCVIVQESSATTV